MADINTQNTESSQASQNKSIADRDARRELIELEIQKKEIRKKAKSYSANVYGTEFVLGEIFMDPDINIAAKIEAVKALANETEFSHIELVRILKKMKLSEKAFAELQTKLVRALPLIFVPEIVPEHGDELKFNEEMELRLSKAVQIAESAFDFHVMSPDNFEVYAVFCSDEFIKSVCDLNSDDKYMSALYREALLRSVDKWCKRHSAECEQKKSFIKTCFEQGGILKVDPDIFERVYNS